MARKTAKDYKKDYTDTVAKVKVLEARIKKRCMEMCNLFPDADVGKDGSGTTAGDFLEVLEKHDFNVEVYTGIMSKIEKHIADQHPHQQGDLFPGHKTSENAVRIANPETKDKRFEVAESYFIEYYDKGDGYVHPERKTENEVLKIRLYCSHENCMTYIKGQEGYNGAFHAETGQYCDLRNQGFKCKKHC